MTPYRTAGHEELWISALPSDRGPEGNLRMWEEAEKVLDGMCSKVEDEGASSNEALLCALVDAYNRCIEERRRARDLLDSHRKWSRRRIGGVREPASSGDGAS